MSFPPNTQERIDRLSKLRSVLKSGHAFVTGKTLAYVDPKNPAAGPSEVRLSIVDSAGSDYTDVIKAIADTRGTSYDPVGKAVTLVTNGNVLTQLFSRTTLEFQDFFTFKNEEDRLVLARIIDGEPVGNISKANDNASVAIRTEIQTFVSKLLEACDEMLDELAPLASTFAVSDSALVSHLSTVAKRLNVQEESFSFKAMIVRTWLCMQRGNTTIEAAEVLKRQARVIFGSANNIVPTGAVLINHMIDLRDRVVTGDWLVAAEAILESEDSSGRQIKNTAGNWL